MKTQVLRTSIVALLVAVAGHAQSTLQLHANIPFSFVAGRATLNAGQGANNGEIGEWKGECVPVDRYRAMRCHPDRFQAGLPSLRRHLPSVADLDSGTQMRPSGAGYQTRARAGGEAKGAGRDYHLGHALNETVLRQACEGLSRLLLIAVA